MHVHGDGVVVLAHPGHLVAAADVDAEFAGAFAEQPLQQLLRQRQGVHRRIRQVGEVQVHPAEREPGSRHRAGARRFEPCQQASVAQQFQDLAAQAAGLGGVAWPRLPFQHQRPHSGQAQFGGQHETGRAGPHDDHVGVPCRPRYSQIFSCGPGGIVVLHHQWPFDRVVVVLHQTRMDTRFLGALTVS